MTRAFSRSPTVTCVPRLPSIPGPSRSRRRHCAGWLVWALALARVLIRPDRYVPAAVALNAAALAVLWLARLASGTLPSASG